MNCTMNIVTTQKKEMKRVEEYGLKEASFEMNKNFGEQNLV